jgi:YD repeat-containing protein
VRDPDGKVWAFGYDSSHQMLTMTDPRGGVITNSYDTSRRVSTQSDQMNRATTYTYTADGTSITDPMGHVTAQGYTAGELTTLTKGVGTAGQSTWQYAYDQYILGVTAVTDPNGNINRHSYDPDGNLTSSTDGSQTSLSRLTACPSGQMSALTPRLGAVFGCSPGRRGDGE